jgi:hypothetical protein
MGAAPWEGGGEGGGGQATNLSPWSGFVYFPVLNGLVRVRSEDPELKSASGAGVARK